jgi:ABC-type transporter Mla subunit MlaD
MTGVDVVIGTEELRDGAHAAAGVADGAGPLVDRLGGLVLTAGSFGRVELAEPLAAALVTARDGFRDLGDRVRQFHAGLAERARSTAARSDQLVMDTTAAAQSGRPVR